MLRRFWLGRGGNFAVIAALLALPLILAIGASIDTARHYAAQNHLQNLADNASLAAAVSREQDPAKLRDVAQHFIEANLARGTLGAVAIDAVAASEKSVQLKLSGNVKTTLMGLVGFTTLPVSASATAERNVSGSIEVALVLDNTFSMSGPGTTGQKIASLKSAASGLVTKLMASSDGAIRIGLVPYADYVNVGAGYGGASWIKLDPQDQPSCGEEKRSYCSLEKVPYPCTKSNDGIPYQSTCGGGCAVDVQSIPYDPPRITCSTPKPKYFYGCVGSRIGGNNRLNDLNPSVTYPGLVDDIIKCPTPIIPLTDSTQQLINGINSMVVQRSYYQPKTYIPIGLIWGQNVLSPVLPFTEGAAYDSTNRKPRKIMILMTDGANTMTFYDYNGHHGEIRGGENPESEISASDMIVRKREQAETDAASLSICSYAKAQKIEIYTVAFMVDTTAGKKLMQDCATDAAHYFDAADQPKLLDAFSGIADSISRLRLAR